MAKHAYLIMLCTVTTAHIFSAQRGKKPDIHLEERRAYAERVDLKDAALNHPERWKKVAEKLGVPHNHTLDHSGYVIHKEGRISRLVYLDGMSGKATDASKHRWYFEFPTMVKALNEVEEAEPRQPSCLTRTYARLAALFTKK